ncbi:unnamed protein product [Nezara viridula]|uniref:Trehalase n=1 Tax=Nezara viridula TaxID=85310 RepID=A0A9P0H2H4_NEZVI|nr:unnamed protein product [Nezara viridula]
MNILCLHPLINLFITVIFFREHKCAEPPCQSDIYCKGELLHTIQMAKIYPDSKTFVDKKLKVSVKQVLENYNETFKQFNKFNKVPRELVKQFVNDNFEDGDELKVWHPSDWTQYPNILKKIDDQHLRKWANKLNNLWKTFSRKVTDNVKENPELYSIIHVPNGFIIPGGRFKELYYWDTYWIVNGLLICDMVQTAKGVIENLLYLVKIFGHVPNGSRVYYLQRSQPPMLTLMVESYFLHTGDFNFIKNNIEVLDKEINYWLDKRSINIVKNGVTYTLYRYFAPSSGPRPESYSEDFETTALCSNETERFIRYIAIKSAAESGWDFSSRWFVKQGSNEGNLTDTMTQNIIPVDLNALLHRNFVILLEWYKILGDNEKIQKYTRLSESTLKAIEEILWNKEEEFWFDYDIVHQQSRNYFYLSNFVPLWTKSYRLLPMELTRIVLNYITKHNLQHYPGGTPSSLKYTGEQWDFPNAWPPLQAFFIQGLDRIGSVPASEAAFFFANRFVQSSYKGFKDTGFMFEKYDSLEAGKTGGGGEYDGQTGFGWTNGLIFEFFKRWGSRLRVFM